MASPESSMMKPAATCAVLLLRDASTQEVLASLSCKDSREPNGLSSGTGLFHPVVFSPPKSLTEIVGDVSQVPAPPNSLHAKSPKMQFRQLNGWVVCCWTDSSGLPAIHRTV